MKRRLDVALTERGLADSRAKAAAAISDGYVSVNGVPVRKPSYPTEETDVLTVSLPGDTYVSRAGRKLSAALDAFEISPAGKTVLDIGASTGGFTDCLLRRGAAFVYAVDVGTGQLHPSLREDPRVRNMEKTNARYLTKELFDRPVDLAVADVSFISQTYLYPSVAPLLPAGAPFVTLVKPQFEVGPEGIGKNGIVRDPNGKRTKAMFQNLVSAAAEAHLVFRRSVDSPIPGGDGNREYLALFTKE